MIADKVNRALYEIEAAVGSGEWTGAKSTAVRLKYLLTIRDAIRRAENAE
jgi:hypothetical protein